MDKLSSDIIPEEEDVVLVDEQSEISDCTVMILF
jgi:hypothetical protein